MRDKKAELMDRWNPQDIINDVLGPGRGNKRRCFNQSAHKNGDKDASLTFSPKSGAWTCWGCGEKGDIFTLLEKVKGMGFPQALEFLLRKYSLWDDTRNYAGKKGNRTELYPGLRKGGRLFDAYLEKGYCFGEMQHRPHKEALLIRYGINDESIRRWKLVLDGGKGGSLRLLIPIPRGRISDGNYVNIRAHDVFRVSCNWTNKDTGEVSRSRPKSIGLIEIATQTTDPWIPDWKGRQGKVVSEKDHGAPFVYPMEVLLENPAVYVVGGELKALLLNQLGVPAVSFTGGESSVPVHLLPLFLGKRVRVLYDPDQAGVEGVFGRPGIAGVAAQLCEAGAYVEAGRWPDKIKESLPPKGDITDLLRYHDWDLECLENIEWVKITRVIQDEEVLAERIVGKIQPDPPLKDIEKVSFRDIVDPSRVGKWVQCQALVAGRGEAPYAVPRSVGVKCITGQKSPIPSCKSCALASCNFVMNANIGLDIQLSLVGSPTSMSDVIIRRELGIPERCRHPDMGLEYSAIEQVILTPTINNTRDDGGDGDFHFEHRQALIIRPDNIDMRENVGYAMTGVITPNPSTGRFVLAAPEFEASDSDVLRFQSQEGMNMALRKYMDGSVPNNIKKLVGDIRDHVARIYFQDEMILSILIGMVMPFKFRLGNDEAERVSPFTLILGDSTVGKSTTAKRIMTYMGGGRFSDMGGAPTFVGLVGGNVPTGGGRMAFAWGLIPTSHRGTLVLDEFAKLPTSHIGQLTNLLSSGVAERTTATGDRRTLAHVRLVALTNPRTPVDGPARPLGAEPPMEQAYQVMGTVQDFSRVEFVHIQPAVKDKSLFRHLPPPERETTAYTQALARYHLSYIWSLTSNKIKFEDPDYIRDKAADLSDRYRGHTLLLPPMAPFKLARIACGIAALEFSTSNGMDLVVRKAHVDFAVSFLQRRYDPFLGVNRQVDIPQPLSKFLDRLDNYHLLGTLVSSRRFTRDDVRDIVGELESRDFIRLLQVEYGWITRSSIYYSFREPRFAELLSTYIRERQSREAADHDGYLHPPGVDY